MTHLAGDVWDLMLQDMYDNPVFRVTLLMLGSPPTNRVYAMSEGLVSCLVIDSTEPRTWSVGDVGDWSLTDFHNRPAQRLT
jgi:hypothetical protein